MHQAVGIRQCSTVITPISSMKVIGTPSMLITTMSTELRPVNAAEERMT